MARGYVMTGALDANGYDMGRAYANPTLDTRMYQVDFAGGKVSDINESN